MSVRHSPVGDKSKMATPRGQDTSEWATLALPGTSEEPSVEEQVQSVIDELFDKIEDKNELVAFLKNYFMSNQVPVSESDSLEKMAQQYALHYLHDQKTQKIAKNTTILVECCDNDQEAYELYKQKASNLKVPLKEFDRLASDCRNTFGNRQVTKEAAKKSKDALYKAFDKLQAVRFTVIDSWTEQAKESDTFLDSRLSELNRLEQLYRSKFTTKKIATVTSTLAPSASASEPLQIKIPTKGLLTTVSAFNSPTVSQVAEIARADLESASARAQAKSDAKAAAAAAAAEANARMALEDELAKLRQEQLKMSQFTATLQDRLANLRRNSLSVVTTPRGLSPTPSVQENNSVYRFNAQLDGAAEIPQERAVQLATKVKPQENIVTNEHLLNAVSANNFNIKELSQVFNSDSYKDEVARHRAYKKWFINWQNVEERMDLFNMPPLKRYNCLLQSVEGEALDIVYVDFPNASTYSQKLKELNSKYQVQCNYIRELLKDNFRMNKKMETTEQSLKQGQEKVEKTIAYQKVHTLSVDQLYFLATLNFFEPWLCPKTTEIWERKKWEAKDDSNPLGFNLTHKDLIDSFEEARQFARNKKFNAVSSNNANNNSNNNANNNGKGKNNNNNRAHSSQVDKKDKKKAKFPQNPSDPKMCPLPGCKMKKHEFPLRCPRLAYISRQDLIKWASKNKVTCNKCFAIDHESKECRLRFCLTCQDKNHNAYICPRRKGSSAGEDSGAEDKKVQFSDEQ